MDTLTILNNRTKTSFNVSIGTGLMLESIFDPITTRYDDNKIINKIDKRKYSVHFINILTLIRNIITSVPSSAVQKEIVISSDIVDSIITILKYEIDILESLYKDIDIKPILYIPDYSKIEKAIPLYVNKNILTGHKYNLAVVKDRVIDKLLSGNIDFNLDIIGTTHRLPTDNSNAIITTHIALDLLNINKIPKLELLESHTGLLKDRYKWYRKYHPIGKRDLSILPFKEKLLYILGDRGSNRIRPLNLKLRTNLYDIALNDKWTPYTSDDKIKNSLSKDSDLLSYYNSFQKLY